MSQSLEAIPELVALRNASGVVRIPPGVDVPMTPRVRAIVDSRHFRRLSSIAQLGLVGQVYPGATHTRFEHSLGVYRTALLFLQRLAGDERFVATVDAPLAERFLVAALLHDVGHWPYCHPIEDMALAQFRPHESIAREYLADPELSNSLLKWGTTGDEVADLLEGRAATVGERIVDSLLSSPIDVDKVDYLQRDSLHAGVPYGNHFDQGRLIGSLCLNAAGDGVALTDKGKTAAELLVFARYVMFSEVYWHHAVRSATAMLQRLIWEVRERLDVPKLEQTTDTDFRDIMCLYSDKNGLNALAEGGVWSNKRQLYKRLAQYSLAESPEVYRRLAQQPYERLVSCGNRLAEILSSQLRRPVAAHDVLIDAPPMALEVQFDVDVHFTKQRQYRKLGEISPVVRALAREQFDDYVKRVRVFVAPGVRKQITLEPAMIDALVIEVCDGQPS